MILRDGSAAEEDGADRLWPGGQWRDAARVHEAAREKEESVCVQEDGGGPAG